MGLLGKLVKTTLNTAALPLDVVSDIFTMGGQLTDDERSAIMKRLEKIQETIDEMGDD